LIETLKKHGLARLQMLKLQPTNPASMFKCTIQKKRKRKTQIVTTERLQSHRTLVEFYCVQNIISTKWKSSTKVNETQHLQQFIKCAIFLLNSLATKLYPPTEGTHKKAH